MKKMLSKITVVSLVLVALVSCGAQNQNNSKPSQDNSQTSSSQQNTPSQNDKYIGEEKAKEIALKHAELNIDNVNFIKVSFEYDDNKAQYEIEFYKDNKEFDYEIDAVTGDIISYDYDIENYTIPDSNSNATISIKDTDAKRIALEHAKLNESDVAFSKVLLDYDDGKPEYEVEFFANNKEYDYTIDANTGDILDFEMDSN